MHEQWEYKVLSPSGLIPTKWRDEDGEEYQAKMTEEWLDKLGQDGWELCALTFGIAVFKRRRSDTQ